jgi:hypothetical protein
MLAKLLLAPCKLPPLNEDGWKRSCSLIPGNYQLIRGDILLIVFAELTPNDFNGALRVMDHAA